MSKRNLTWLAAIIAVGVLLGVTAGWLWGLLAAGATLLASEVLERAVRRRRVAARGAERVRPVRGALRRKRG